MRKIIALSLGDMKNISRDSMLIMAFGAPFLMAFALKFGLPLASQKAMELIGLDLTVYYDLIMSFGLLAVPAMVGVMVGFIILDERDEGLLSYYSVTPLSKSGYIAYRLVAPFIICFVLSFIVLVIAGVAEFRFFSMVPIVFMISLEAPLMALFLGSFASNKVEGLALAKGIGTMMLAPVAGYFIKSNWQILLGVFPPYWISKAFLARSSVDVNYLLYILSGILIHFVFISLLLKRFNHREA